MFLPVDFNLRRLNLWLGNKVEYPFTPNKQTCRTSHLNSSINKQIHKAGVFPKEALYVYADHIKSGCPTIISSTLPICFIRFAILRVHFSSICAYLYKVAKPIHI